MKDYVIHCSKHDQEMWFSTRAEADESLVLMQLYCDGKHELHDFTNPTHPTNTRSKG